MPNVLNVFLTNLYTLSFSLCIMHFFYLANIDVTIIHLRITIFGQPSPPRNPIFQIGGKNWEVNA